MGEELNVPLFVLDFIVILPVTLLRLFIIYVYGSRYNIPSFEILDVMMHAKDPKFNNGGSDVDVNEKNIANVINDMINPTKNITELPNNSRLHKKPSDKSRKKPSNKSSNKINKELCELEKKSKKYIDSDTIYDLIKTVDDDNHQQKQKPKSKSKPNDNLNQLTQMISNMANTTQKKPKPKIEKISVIKDSPPLIKSKKSKLSQVSQISSLNIPELINTSSESDDSDDSNQNHESSFAITFTDDK